MDCDNVIKNTQLVVDRIAAFGHTFQSKKYYLRRLKMHKLYTDQKIAAHWRDHHCLCESNTEEDTVSCSIENPQS